MNRILLAIILLVPYSLVAQDWDLRMVQFRSTLSNTDEYSTLIDYDGDGLKDVLFGNEYRKELFLMRNTEGGDLQLEQLTDTLYGTLGLQVCQYNNDGLDDFIIAASTTVGEDLWVCVNQGNGNFEWIYVSYAPYEGIKKIIASDFDFDGDMDFIYDDLANSNVIWTVINNGDDTFTQTYIDYTGQPTGLFGASDLDGDNDLDLLTTYFNFGSSTFVLVAEENMGGMVFQSHEGPSLTGTYSGIIGDFVGDTQPDLLISSNINPGVFYENMGGFEFQISTVNPNVAIYSLLGPTLDWNNDGQDDFYAVDGSELIRITQNTNGTYSSEILVNDASGAVKYNYDFNQDGSLDLMNEYREIWLQDNGLFEKVYSSYSHATGKMVALNTTPEGNLDLMCGGAAGQCSFFNQNYNEQVAYPSEVFLTGENIDYNTSMKDTWVYDKDGDGDDDVLCVISSYMFWLVNNNGTYVQQTISSTISGFNPWVGDLDNDGQHDILLYDVPLKRWEWNGNSYSTSTLSFNVMDSYGVMDVDDDGDKDILYFNWDIDAQEWELFYLKNNNNTFANIFLMNMSQNFPIDFNLLGEGQYSVRDLDLDGDDDLVFASGEISFTDDSDFIGWLRHDGPELFEPLVVTDEVGQFRSFDTGDFDLDGDIDIVSSVGEDFGLMIHRNDGSENFAVENLAFQVSGPLTVLSADMDNDTDLDIAFASAVDRRIGWLENMSIDCQRQYTSEAVTLCQGDSIWFDGALLDDAGIYGDTLVAYSGCDSVHVLVLNITEVATLTISRSVNTLSANLALTTYNWFYEGEMVSTMPTLDVADFGLGTYELVGLMPNGCENVSQEFTVTTIIGIEESKDWAMAIGPNPVQFALQINSFQDELGNIQVFDACGKLVNEQMAVGHKASVDFSPFAPGIYTLVCRGRDGRMTATRIEKL